MPGIIVGFDGSDRSLGAVDWAIREAAIRQAPLTVFTVTRGVAGHWGDAVRCPRELAQAELAQGEQARQQVQQEADTVLEEGPAPPSITVMATAGQPAEVLLKAAEDADLLVVGARGGGGFRQLPLGSVSTQVTHHAPCPVVVIPADDA